MRGGQRAFTIKLDEHLTDLAIHQIPRKTANAQRSRTV